MIEGRIDAVFIDNPLDIPEPAEHNPTLNNILGLDDVIICPQSKAEAYYWRGCHNSVDTIYITQSNLQTFTFSFHRTTRT